MGVLGRLLKETIEKNNQEAFEALESIGASNKNSWLYGKFSPISIYYLTYAAYRADIILRETVIVGVVGGVGLGWQLNESLSSFAWEEVIIITTTFISITLAGEILGEKLRNQMLRDQKLIPTSCSS